MRNIRSLSLGRLTTAKLAAEDFVEFGVELEDLKIAHSALETIRSHAFKNVRGIRRLDLSENRISQIQNDAFTEVIAWLNHASNVFQKKKTILISDRSFANIVENIPRTVQFVDRISRGSISFAHLTARARFEQQLLELDQRYEFSFSEQFAYTGIERQCDRRNSQRNIPRRPPCAAGEHPTEFQQLEIDSTAHIRRLKGKNEIEAKTCIRHRPLEWSLRRKKKTKYAVVHSLCVYVVIRHLVNFN